jgi:hypothetical protein
MVCVGILLLDQGDELLDPTTLIPNQIKDAVTRAQANPNMMGVLAIAPVVMSTHRRTERSEVRAEWASIITGAMAGLSHKSSVKSDRGECSVFLECTPGGVFVSECSPTYTQPQHLHDECGNLSLKIC